MNSAWPLLAFSLMLAASAAGLFYSLLQAVREGMQAYAGDFAERTARQYEDLFLFIPAQRIARMARISAVIVFMLFFILVGNFHEAGGLFRGVLFGALAAGGALYSPRLLLRILRKRRRDRFDAQLVDALVSMSSALRAGFSIMQAYESIVKQGLDPIAQEFGMFLQQLRIGVRFEEALHRMEERVGSEDLVLMNRSIEVSRQTGGNLTEVFDKIAMVIRERTRIQQRLRSLTAQGRLQAWVVGSVPLALLLVLTMVDPRMMMPFFLSRGGWLVLALVLVMETAGICAIRKIVRINA